MSQHLVTVSEFLHYILVPLTGVDKNQSNLPASSTIHFNDGSLFVGNTSNEKMREYMLLLLRCVFETKNETYKPFTGQHYTLEQVYKFSYNFNLLGGEMMVFYKDFSKEKKVQRTLIPALLLSEGTARIDSRYTKFSQEIEE